MAPRSAAGPSRASRVRAGAQLWLVNVALAVALCVLYVPHAPPVSSLGSGLVLAVQLLSSAVTLTVPVGLVLLLATLLVPWPRALALGSALLWTLLQVALLVDTRIYGIFRYHFNGLVWNVITTPGADEAVHVQASEWLIVAGGAALLAAAQVFLFGWLLRRERARRNGGRPARRLARPAWVWSLLLLPVVLTDKAIYAHADVVRDRQVMAFSRVFPFYQRVTVKRVLRKHFGLELAEREEVDLPTGELALAYPHALPELGPAAERTSIVLIAVESLRADMLAPDTMPQLSALSERGRVFADHLSGGNATRFGVFSLVYGLHGAYWRPIYNEQRSPVLVDALLASGHDMIVLTAASMDYPEFRSTCWVRIEDVVEDRIPTDREGGRDDGVAERFERWLGERQGGAPPFFAFVQLDGPHQAYDFPEEHAVFAPYADGLRYLEIAGGQAPEEVELIFNRYRNSVHYVDAVIARLYAALEAEGLAESTLFVVTGDHGQEFFENGYFGHTSNFTREQAQVPLVLIGPGVEPGVETLPTCHVDVPATLLELLGADPALTPQWCLGRSLLDPDPERRRVVSGWDDLGLMAPGGIVRVPFESYGGLLEGYDYRWQPLPDDRALIRAEGPALVELALECRRFLR
jgi:membrane-anchored protein YejM (alkaline phosphatase superfamily)